MKRCFTLALLAGFVLLSSLVQAQPLENSFLITTSGSYAAFTTTTTLQAVRFTAQYSAPITQVRIQCFYLASGSTPITYRCTLRADDAGGTQPGSVLATSPDFVWTTDFWSVLPMSPTPTLTAGAAYYLQVEWVSGPISVNNWRTWMVTTPAQPFYPRDNWLDSKLQFMTSNDTGSNWVNQSLHPVFVVEYANGYKQGDPYYYTVNLATHGGASPPSAALTDDPVPGEGVTWTGSGTTNVLGISARVTRGALAPTDDLYFSLRDITGSTLLATGPLAFSTNVLTASPGWVTIGLPVAAPLNTTNQYRLSFFSPGARSDRPFTMVGIGFVDIDPAYIAASHQDAYASLVLSTDGGNTFSNSVTQDLNYRFLTTPPLPTNTPTGNSPGTWWGNQASVANLSAGASITGATQRVALRFTVQSGGTLAAAWVGLMKNGAPGNYHLELYRDDIGNPGLFVATSSSFTPASGMQSVTFPTTPSLTAGDVCYLVFVPEGAVDNINWVMPTGTLPFHQFVPSHQVFDPNVNYLYFNGSEWAPRNVQPVYVLEYQTGSVASEGNPYNVWELGGTYDNDTPDYHADDVISAQAVSYSGPNHSWDAMECWVNRVGSPGPLYYQILRTDAGEEQMLASGPFLASGNYTTTGWYPVRFLTPIQFVTGQQYRIQLYCLSGNALNRWDWISPETDSYTLLQQTTFGGSTGSNGLRFSAGPASVATSYLNADRPFRFNIFGSVVQPVPTATITKTPGGTPGTPTFTYTLSSTPTLTPTFSITPSPTLTFTPSITLTRTPSFTPSFTPSHTASSTSTPTPSPTYSWTPSPSNTPSFTPSATATRTPSDTPTATATDSATPSPTSSFTFTPTPTPSFTSTATSTKTPTPSWTPSFTATFSATPSPTPSWTASPTSTATDSATPSPTSSFTFTITLTPTWSFTPTPSSTASATPTLTLSPTITLTFTITNTPRPSNTPTVTPTPNVPLTLDFNSFNPFDAPLGLNGRLFSRGYVKVRVLNITGQLIRKLVDGMYEAGNYRFLWDGKNADGTIVGNGVYYVVADSPAGRTIKKVIIIK